MDKEQVYILILIKTFQFFRLQVLLKYGRYLVIFGKKLSVVVAAMGGRVTGFLLLLLCNILLKYNWTGNKLLSFHLTL
jgi:hypothetical protein